MAKLSLVLDPDATAANRGVLQDLVKQFNGLQGSQKFLEIPGYSGNMTITDNIYSRIVTKGNFDANFKDPDFVENFRALNQKVGPLAIIFNPKIFDPNNQDKKPKINILVHEIGHIKWPNLGDDRRKHDPRFYALLSNALVALGLKVDIQQDLQGTDISNVILPSSAVNDPLGFSFKGALK